MKKIITLALAALMAMGTIAMVSCEKEEEKLDLPALIAAAVENTERIIVYGKDKPERRNIAEEPTVDAE